MLRPDIAEKLQLRRVGEITVQGIAGEERVATYEGAVFDIGGATFSPRRIGGMAGTRRKRDGIIGSGLFRQYVVEMDVASNRLVLHNPETFTYSGPGETVPLRFRRSTPIIDCVINRTNGSVVRGSFEIDTGCDSGVCVGSEFTRTNAFLDELATKSDGKYGVGGGTSTRSGHLPQLQIGSIKVDKPQTDFFLEGSPVDGGLAGHIGMDVLKDFHAWFDYGRQKLILERYPPKSAR
jgi:hypothetical protein